MRSYLENGDRRERGPSAKQERKQHEGQILRDIVAGP